MLGTQIVAGISSVSLQKLVFAFKLHCNILCVKRFLLIFLILLLHWHTVLLV